MYEHLHHAYGRELDADQLFNMAEIFPNEGLDLIYAGFPKGGTGPANTWIGLFTGGTGSTLPGASTSLNLIGTWVEVSAAGAYTRQTISSSSWGTVGTTQSGRGSGAAQHDRPRLPRRLGHPDGADRRRMGQWRAGTE